jgi:BirA family biotin operon repressor/biotin-[acetyl-CoA-carboxylase] ligase
MREPLDVESVREAVVRPGSPWQEVEFLPQVGSTNERAAAVVRQEGSYAAGLGSLESPLWRAVVTDDQTGGRGRLGRSWEAPPRASIAVSTVVPAPPVRDLGWVPLLAGVALARAIEAVAGGAPGDGAGVRPRLKWPNDVLLGADDDRKVAGILCELVMLDGAGRGAGGDQVVVIGTGINVDQSRDELPVNTATSLRLAGAELRREDLLASYLAELATVLQEGQQARTEYRARCSTLGSEVQVHVPTGDVVAGRAVSVDDSGALVVDVGGVQRAYAAGDVVHVRPQG